MKLPAACGVHAIAVGVGVVLLGLANGFAQTVPPPSGIYTCTDANGRKLRSDRPIPACLDREQTILNPSGTVRARVGPSLSVRQRVELEQRNKEEAAAQARVLEERRRDRAMLARYPSREAHDKDRAEAFAGVDLAVQEAEKRILALQEERNKNNRELEFYQGDPAKAPPALQRQIDYVAEGLLAQRRFIQAHENERRRIAARFDEELARLNVLWQDQARAQPGAAPRAGARP